MATKHITDRQVCQAFADYKAHGQPFADERLQQATAQPSKVVHRAMERALRRGYIDFGVTIRSGWLTEQGAALLAIHQAADSMPATVDQVMVLLRTLPSGPHDRSDYMRAIERMLQRLVGARVAPVGWKLVPLEPTPGMLDAFNGYAQCEGFMAEGYRAMLEAAPPAGEAMPWKLPPYPATPTEREALAKRKAALGMRVVRSCPATRPECPHACTKHDCEALAAGVRASDSDQLLQARGWLKGDALDCLAPYVNADRGDGSVTLDGGFSAAELRAIAALIEPAAAGVKACPVHHSINCTAACESDPCRPAPGVPASAQPSSCVLRWLGKDAAPAICGNCGKKVTPGDACAAGVRVGGEAQQGGGNA